MKVGTELSGKKGEYVRIWSRKECSQYGEEMCSKITTALHKNAV